ncbi:hypothetical protein ABXT06_07500 [Flavobacterium sp. UW10123]|uniref:hypothetical protein n=1 Tax=Flavobacterium sp. UW10123 TaxID=3230800 RepID=UPI0033991EFE
MKNFELYWKEIHIGSLIETNWDMRSSGDIAFSADFLKKFSEEIIHLSNLIKNSIRLSIYLENGETGDDGDEILEEENKFLDLINSTDWYLINEKEEKVKILCPFFHEDNGITWQLDI